MLVREDPGRQQPCTQVGERESCLSPGGSMEGGGEFVEYCKQLFRLS